MQIHIAHVSKSFKTQKVLQDISLEIENNEIFGLIGPSGAGKTTLVRLIIGALAADTGTIKVGDITIPSFKALDHIGYMPQNEAIYSDLTGYENLLFFGSMYGLSKNELNKRALEVLELVDLAGDRKKKAAKYSGGMRKRLSLAVALIAEPSLLILDEPTVGIDPLLRRRIWQHFYEFKARGKTIIITTHVMDEAELCDRVALINGGCILACNTIEALKAHTQNHSIEDLFFENGGTGA